MKSFKYGKPVTGSYFVNRESELNKLYELTMKVKKGGEVNIALIGLRRTGKTSILKNFEKSLKRDKKIVPVFLDCYGIPSKTTLAKLLIENIKNAYIEKTKDQGYGKKITELLKGKASDLISKISSMDISIANYLSIRMAFKEDVTEDIWEKALEYAEALGKSKNLYFVIILDEFPDLAMRWKGDFIKRFRSVIQHQNRVMYILSGSTVTYMIDLIHNKDSPLYRQLTLIRLEEMPKSVIRDFVNARLDIEPKVLERYIELTGSFPDYMQRLGHILISKFGTNKISMTKLNNAYIDMLGELEAEFSATLGRLNQKSNKYGDIILSLSKYSSPSQIASNIKIPLGFLPKYLNYLINIGIVRRIGRGEYILTDPVFKAWVARRFESFHS